VLRTLTRVRAVIRIFRVTPNTRHCFLDHQLFSLFPRFWRLGWVLGSASRSCIISFMSCDWSQIKIPLPWNLSLTCVSAELLIDPCLAWKAMCCYTDIEAMAYTLAAPSPQNGAQIFTGYILKLNKSFAATLPSCIPWNLLDPIRCIALISQCCWLFLAGERCLDKLLTVHVLPILPRLSWWVFHCQEKNKARLQIFVKEILVSWERCK
jgi:hypothetical protein